MLKGGEKMEQGFMVMNKPSEHAISKRYGMKNKGIRTNCFAEMIQSSLQEKKEQPASEVKYSKTTPIKRKTAMSCNNNQPQEVQRKTEGIEDETKDVEEVIVEIPWSGQEIPLKQLLQVMNDTAMAMNAAGFKEESKELLQNIQVLIASEDKGIDLKSWMQGIGLTPEKLLKMVEDNLGEKSVISTVSSDESSLNVIECKEELASVNMEKSMNQPSKQDPGMDETKKLNEQFFIHDQTKDINKISKQDLGIDEVKKLNEQFLGSNRTKNVDKQTKISFSTLAVKEQEKAVLQPSNQNLMSNMLDGNPKNVLFQPIMEMGKETAVMEAGESSSPENVMEQIVAKASLLSKDGLHEMKIQLKPEYLGELSMKVALENGTLTAKFFVQNHQVREAIESQMIQLRHHFDEQGLKVQNVEVFVGQDHDLQQQSFGSHSFQQEHSKQQFHFSNGYREEEEIVWEDEIINHQLMASTGMSESVDYRV